MMKSVFLGCFVIIGISISCYSQSFKWIKQIGDKQSDVDPICKILPDGQSIFVWSYTDSTKIDGFKPKSQKAKNIFMISMLNNEGKAKWVWKPDSCFSVIDPTGLAYSESSGKIFVCGNFNKNATINKVTYRGNNNGFVIRLDTNGTFEKIYILSDTSALIFESMYISSQNDILIGIQYNNSGSNFKLSIPSLGFSINKRGCFLLKLDKDLRPQKASEPEYGIKVSKFLINIKSKNQILSVSTFMDTLSIGSNFYYNGKNVYSTYITYWDSNLIFKRNALIFYTLSTASAINSLKCFSDGSILIAGRYRDSINLISKKYKNNQGISLLACLDSNLNLKWAKVPDIKAGERITSEIMDMEISGDYIIAGGIFGGNAHYDDFHLPDTMGIFWFFKTDSRGNILWMQRCANSIKGQFVSSISANSQKEILIAGYIVDTVKLNKQVFITQKSKPDVFLMKIHDIEIHRGYVKSGPYCAGDTIKIPYTKDGDFNSGNEFIAKLSDAEGNFSGNERELGRLKSSDAGTIKGTLPLFDVESSPHYRIRIISTNPVVQSYYKYDTLRLLIYSKDKASPGSAETICFGDTVQLKTYGGTKWTWSPKYNMNDSSLKKPQVWPNKSTTYKIIIADSSGCGKADTAFKQIIVRNPLRVSPSFIDTVLCDIKPLNISVSFSGGDSNNYIWNWYKVSLSKKIWKPLDSGKFNPCDTLTYTPQINLYTNDTLAIVLTDFCTNNNDTAIMILRLLKPSLLINKYRDTTVCKGTLLNYKPQMEYAQNYLWNWIDLNTNKNLSTNDSMNLTANNTQRLLLNVNNGCTSDSHSFFVKVYPALKATILHGKIGLNDTSLCFGQELHLTAKGEGGKSAGYVYTWFMNAKKVASFDSFFLKTKYYSQNKPLSSTLLLTLDDQCTKISDTLIKTILIKEKPIADFTYGIACTRILTKFEFTGTLPISPIYTGFRWNFNNESSSSLIKPSKQYSSVGISSTTLILASTNGCSDTIKKDIAVKPHSVADFIAVDVCETDSVDFMNKSMDATGYFWKFGDGHSSYKSSVKHKYQITGSTTFNVSLLAKVYEGCSDSTNKPITVNAIPNSNFSSLLFGSNLNLTAIEHGHVKYEWFRQWQNGNADSTITENGYFTYYKIKPDVYKVCLSVTNLAGCVSKTCKDLMLGMSSISKPSGYKVYPNPNTGHFFIEIGNPVKEGSIEVYNCIGNLIKRIATSTDRTVYSIDMLASDEIYWVRIKNGTIVFNQKIGILK